MEYLLCEGGYPGADALYTSGCGQCPWGAIIITSDGADARMHHAIYKPPNSQTTKFICTPGPLYTPTVNVAKRPLYIITSS